jgi:hypothetical protein
MRKPPAPQRPGWRRALAFPRDRGRTTPVRARAPHLRVRPANVAGARVPRPPESGTSTSTRTICSHGTGRGRARGQTSAMSECIVARLKLAHTGTGTGTGTEWATRRWCQRRCGLPECPPAIPGQWPGGQAPVTLLPPVIITVISLIQKQSANLLVSRNCPKNYCI